MAETLVERFCSQRISAERGVGRINVTGFEPQLEQAMQAVGESDDEQQQKNDARSFHEALIFSMLRWKCSINAAVTSCVPYQMRSKVETFSVKVLMSSGKA